MGLDGIEWDSMDGMNEGDEGIVSDGCDGIGWDGKAYTAENGKTERRLRLFPEISSPSSSSVISHPSSVISHPSPVIISPHQSSSVIISHGQSSSVITIRARSSSVTLLSNQRDRTAPQARDMPAAPMPQNCQTSRPRSA